MKVLRVHNYYQQPGGEDQCFAAEIALLEANGHQVVRYTAHNDAIDAMDRIEVAARTLWNQHSYRELRALIRRERPAIAHFDNTFPLISPAAYYAARHEGIPVVQSLHNFRLFCADAYFFRDGRVCEDCLGKALPWPALQHRCYRNSVLATGVVAALQVSHRAIGTWQRQVNRFVALTEFGRRKFIAGGIPAEKIVVKPNFVATDPGIGAGDGGYALFVGRLSPEKGIETLLTAWERAGSHLPLKIVGDGPLRGTVQAAAERLPQIAWLGQRNSAEVLELMRHAAMLVFPSRWYETFGRVIIEAYAVGLPVVASNLGSMSDLIVHGQTGLHARPGDPADLAAQVIRIATNAQERDAMRQGARAAFESAYTAERNYAQLMAIYHACLAATNE
jgi:glycosyltransferase involved in cell wall biosynthesis